MQYRIIEKGSCYRAEIKRWWGWEATFYGYGPSTWHKKKETAIKDAKDRIERILWDKAKKRVVDVGTIQNTPIEKEAEAIKEKEKKVTAAVGSGSLDYWIEHLQTLKRYYGPDTELVIAGAGGNKIPVGIEVSQENGKYVIVMKLLKK